MPKALPKRITDYQQKRLFADFEGTYEALGPLLGQEIIIWDYATGKRFNPDGEEFEYAEFLFSEPEGSEPVFACWTSSKVVVEQLKTVPHDELPVAAEVSQGGKANRKYYKLI